ncbi:MULTISPECIES: ATP-binding cassette domain-containing protein [unclassified Microbacterium]|uniref:ATP-binding cassette domain-containing protein n=1 Tax=unclassified Microbacterium TaxID=2609290 RepID=UPI00097E83A9|nr:ATP-binding cassette domain-containing protein [Microbacterium sp. JB110]RCS57919.1 ATP-binding cassette domain-containing protein [Microbacterium sp. JB110]SJM56233.1 ABC transporter, ATP-binding protein [Frigoribacterium sp. JB110]
MTAVIDVHGLRKGFGPHTVLDGIDLRVAPGEIFALLGPNGAGKTTMINVLTTLAQPDSGTAFVAGCDVLRSPDAVRARIALTGQSAAVDEALGAHENLVMFCRLSGLGRGAAHARADELLVDFGLTDAARRRVATFSGGMRRRLDLALSLVVQPEVLFLDEPTTGLDTRSRRELWGMISSFAANGTTVFLTTQYLEEADELADRIAVLSDGAIVALGTARELKQRVGGATIELHGDDGVLLQKLSTDGTASGVRRALEELDDSTADTNLADAAVSLRRPTLDDVFLALTDPDARSAGRSNADTHSDLTKEPTA